MVQVQHISFKDWNPIGKPHKKPYGSNGDSLSRVKDRTLSNAVLNRNKPTENKDPFGEAATLELTHNYVKEKAASTDMVSASRAAARTLKVGSRGDDVKALQANLNQLGYNAGTPNGIFGTSTKNAVISFQKTYGLSADGIAGTNTLDAISTTVNRKNKKILSKGQVSNDVKNLQNNLISLGYLSGTADGAFGKNTENAVIAFQKKHGLTPDGLVGSDTKKAINKAIKNSGSTTPSNPTGNAQKIQKMLDNLKNDTSLGLSADKKTAMLKAAKRLLNENYEVEFVAGVLGNIQNEGTPGKFESSNYVSNPSAEPSYLKYMDKHFDYRKKFSGKSIQDVGLSAAIDLANKAKNSGYTGKFGLGMIQWTGERTVSLLKSYQKYATSDKPTKEECITAEVNFMVDELKGNYASVYNTWKNGSKTASSAGDIVCRKYEVPKNTENEAKSRAQNAKKIYNVLLK